MNSQWIWAGVAIYIVVAGMTAYLSKSKHQFTVSDYFLGSRKMGGVVSALSYSATTYSAFMLVGLAGLTYSGGIGALGFELIYLSGIALVLIFGPRFWLVGKKFGYVTPSEMLGDRYENKAVATVAALCSLIFLIPYAAVQLAGVGYLLSGMSDGAISFTAGTILAVILALVFSLVAGLKSVAWTDSLQAIIMVIGATAAAAFVVAKLGGPGEFFATLHADHAEVLQVPGGGFFTFKTFLGLTLPWAFFCLSNPQVSQRLYTPKSFSAMRKMLLIFMVFGFVYTLVATIWGLAAVIKLPGLASGDMATPKLLSSDLVPPVFGIIVMVGIIAAAVSTIDSIILTLSSMFTRDVYRAVKPEATEQQQLAMGKLVLPVIAVMAFIFAQLKVNLIAVLSVSASAGLLVIVPAIIGAFFWRRGTAVGAMSSIIISGIVVLVMELFSIRFMGLSSGVWGLVLSTGIFIVGSLITPRPQARAQEFMDHVQESLKKYKIV